jgi:type III secretory pathway component EscR
MILKEETQKLLASPEPLNLKIKVFILSFFKKEFYFSTKNKQIKESFTQEQLVLILNFFIKEQLVHHSKITIKEINEKLEKNNNFSSLSNEILNQYYSFLIKNDGNEYSINAKSAFNLLEKYTTINPFFNILKKF